MPSGSGYNQYNYDDDDVTGTCWCHLCNIYGWHATAPWYAKLLFRIKKWWSGE